MKKDLPKIPKRVQLLCQDLEFLFGVNGFDRTLVNKEKDDDDKAASVFIDESYQRITISLYPLFFKESLRDQRMFLLHEFCHTVTHGLLHKARNLHKGKFETEEHITAQNEKTVSQMTNLLDGLLRGRYSYARTAYQKYLDVKKE